MMEHLDVNLADDGCDSPSGSSTSEPHEDFYMYQPIISPPLSNTISKSFTDYSSSREPGMQIRVLGVPQTGAKSRVETQIKLCIQLVTDNGNKVQKWTHLKLPTKDNQITIQQENTLFLSARVICASDPTRQVTPCLGCIQRERKRSQRRKEHVSKDNNVDILLFNCSETVDFSAGDTILPTRITCYCRHHNEKLGFCIQFQVYDYTGKQLATGMSPPIMITDDHKGKKRPRTEHQQQQQQMAGPSQYPIQPRPIPMIQRLIPSEGPTFGGVEITLLGTGFRSGLTCMFGDVPAATTHFWSPNTLVCILPPAINPGTVVVSFKEYPVSDNITTFTYFNESDRALIELALQVVGLKMTGKVEDARDIAMRIVQGGNQEYQVMQMMKTGSSQMDVSVMNAQGHGMLHLASMLGYSQLVQYLVDLGCRVNDVDKNGFTALHYAAWYNREQVVLILLEQGLAGPEITNKWNKKPIQLTENSSIQQRLKYGRKSDEPIRYLSNSESIEPDAIQDKTWMQRTFTSDNLLFQNFMPVSDFKTMLPATIFEKKQELSEQALAWYMALAYAMGTKSLKEPELQPNTDTTSVEVCTKRRDKRLFSFWVSLLCLMIVWLIYQLISSYPSVVDTIIGISGFRRQYLTIHH